VAGEELVRQRRDVLAPLPQRRDVDAEHVQAVEQVGAEEALATIRSRSRAGGRDDPDVDGERLRGADRPHLLLLQARSSFTWIAGGSSPIS